MPEIVAKGNVSAQPPVYACSLCHYPNGKGRPENANITGLTYEYFMQQMIDFRNGARKTSDPRKANTGLMTHFAKMMTEEEIEACRTNISRRSPPRRGSGSWRARPCRRPGLKAACSFRLEGADAGNEPIGERIIETPEKTHDTEFLRNPRSGFIAYVPPGSLRKGEALVVNGVTSDGNKVTACTVATAVICAASARCRQLRDARRATSRGSSTTCSVGTGTGPGPRLWLPSLPTSARTIC